MVCRESRSPLHTRQSPIIAPCNIHFFLFQPATLPRGNFALTFRLISFFLCFITEILYLFSYLLVSSSSFFNLNFEVMLRQLQVICDYLRDHQIGTCETFLKYVIDSLPFSFIFFFFSNLSLNLRLCCINCKVICDNLVHIYIRLAHAKCFSNT